MARTNQRNKIGGYSLIELLIVMSIIAILASIAVPSYRRHVIKAKEAVLKENLFQMRQAIDAYYADHGRYPGSLGELKDAHYLREIPVDPFTGENDSWTTVAPEAAALPDGGSTETPEGGVFNVCSGSELPGLDGTRYSELGCD